MIKSVKNLSRPKKKKKKKVGKNGWSVKTLVGKKYSLSQNLVTFY